MWHPFRETQSTIALSQLAQISTMRSGKQINGRSASTPIVGLSVARRIASVPKNAVHQVIAALL
jgi:hypothetical protein